MESYTADEVAQHNTVHDCWVIIFDEVYNLTEYLPLHPDTICKGVSILAKAGQDCSMEFEGVNHSKEAEELLQKYKIGTLDE